MKKNILDVGWDRSDMVMWDHISRAGSGWKAFDNTSITIAQ